MAQTKLQMEKPKSIKFNSLHVSAEWPTNITISRVESQFTFYTFQGATPAPGVLGRSEKKNVK